MTRFPVSQPPQRWIFDRKAVVAVVRRPDLWLTAVRQLGRLAPPGWWRRWPPVPRPDPEWMAFRLKTAYGDAAHGPEPHDVVAWLEWCRDLERLRYSRHR